MQIISQDLPVNINSSLIPNAGKFCFPEIEV
jgi:hypothetical protein